MASIFPGYEYDIFISYRQKDNKHDGWVTKFVDNLKGELEAAFKEDVSVYFDENPHDRLQETHNVDKSLEGKLKCLIFIPILSQTYCDPKSYAWQFEFLAFLRMAEKDQFGKDIKLRSGNVAGRILPIRIHDLEPEDVKLFEKETGGVLRALDFVFKTSTGVNRTLKANEDHPNDNLNKTFYSDQINKVALAIKEIVLGMKTGPVTVVKEKPQKKMSLEEVNNEERKAVQELSARLPKLKLLSGILFTAILVIAAILVYPKIFKKDTLGKLRASDGRISVAVLPFQNMTNDTSLNYMQEVIQENLITYLSNFIDELKVRQTESVNTLIQSKGLTNYSSITPSVATTISQKLDANVFIYGSIQQAGLKLRVNAKLIDTQTEEVLKSFEIDGSNKEETIFDITDSLRKKVTDFLIISKLKKELSLDIQPFASSYTNSPEAYRYFISGNNAFDKFDMSTAVKFLLQAIAIDSNFNLAALRLSSAYYNQGLYVDAKKWCLRVYKKREKMPMQLKLWTNRTYSLIFESPYEEIESLRQLQEIDDQLPVIYYSIGRAYSQGLNQYDKAIPEFEKALEIYEKWSSKPSWVQNYILLGESFCKTGQFKKAKKIYRKAEKDFPDDPNLLYYQSILYLTEGDTVTANEYIEKLISFARENSASDEAIKTGLASIYSEAGILDRADKYYRQALSLVPDKAWSLNNLGYFLIDKDINVNEGMELVEKALKLNPDNVYYLSCKGWGLYKQSKNKEALELLEKCDSLKPVYDREIFLHLEAVKKAVARQK
jgi:tetratricopeptide (TPR) repeat protein